MLRQTTFDVNEKTGRIELGVSVDDSDVIRANASLRKELGRGYTPGKTMRAVADIPYEVLQILALRGDKDALVLFSSDSDPMSKRRALRGFLFNHPEYKISDGSV